MGRAGGRCRRRPPTRIARVGCTDRPPRGAVRRSPPPRNMRRSMRMVPSWDRRRSTGPGTKIGARQSHRRRRSPVGIQTIAPHARTAAPPSALVHGTPLAGAVHSSIRSRGHARERALSPQPIQVRSVGRIPTCGSLLRCEGLVRLSESTRGWRGWASNSSSILCGQYVIVVDPIFESCNGGITCTDTRRRFPCIRRVQHCSVRRSPAGRVRIFRRDWPASRPFFHTRRSKHHGK